MSDAQILDRPAVDDRKTPAIQVRGLVTRFGSQVIHEGLDFTVERGEIIGIVGGSGTGKTVLMRTIIGLQRPAAGDIELLGEPMSWAVARRESLPGGLACCSRMGRCSAL